jgi:acetate kinase
MSNAIFVLNAGSSSIKFSLFRSADIAHATVTPDHAGLLCDGQMSGIGRIGHAVHFFAVDGSGATLIDEHLQNDTDHEAALDALLHWFELQFPGQRLIGVGHRVVHGGMLYTVPVLINTNVIAELRRLVPLAPLHQPHHLTAIAALSKLYPGLPQVACFDTSFHHTQPNVASAFALPQALSAEGVRRYGFHGLSYEYIAGKLEQVIGMQLAYGRVVVAHLGSGASMCALKDGKSIATTMGFTALDGLPMSRRCGNLDPGVVLYMMQEKQMSADAVSRVLYEESGLWGVSGISDDMQTLLASEDPRAAQAIDLFVYRISRELGSLVAALGGLDALVFTAGIGEHALEIRRRVCVAAAWLDLQIDDDANVAHGPCITQAGSRVSAWVIPTDEDLMIARHTAALLQESATGTATG